MSGPQDMAMPTPSLPASLNDLASVIRSESDGVARVSTPIADTPLHLSNPLVHTTSMIQPTLNASTPLPAAQISYSMPMITPNSSAPGFISTDYMTSAYSQNNMHSQINSIDQSLISLPPTSFVLSQYTN